MTNSKLQEFFFQFLGSHTQYGPLNMLIIVKPKEHLKSGSIKIIPPTLKKILQEEESLTVEQMLF